MAIGEAVRRMEAAGYRLEVRGGVLRISPAERLNETQRDWLQRNKPALLAYLAATRDRHVADMVERFDAKVVSVKPATAPPPPVYTLPPPGPATVRCLDCTHARLGLPGDETGAWRICLAGAGGRFALQRHHCGRFADKRRLS